MPRKRSYNIVWRRGGNSVWAGLSGHMWRPGTRATVCAAHRINHLPPLTKVHRQLVRHRGIDYLLSTFPGHTVGQRAPRVLERAAREQYRVWGGSEGDSTGAPYTPIRGTQTQRPCAPPTSRCNNYCFRYGLKTHFLKYNKPIKTRTRTRSREFKRKRRAAKEKGE